MRKAGIRVTDKKAAKILARTNAQVNECRSRVKELEAGGETVPST